MAPRSCSTRRTAEASSLPATAESCRTRLRAGLRLAGLLALAACGSPGVADRPSVMGDVGARTATSDAPSNGDALVVRFLDDRGEPLAGRRIGVSHVVRRSGGMHSSGLAGAPRELDESGTLRISARPDWEGEVVVHVDDSDLAGHAYPPGRTVMEWDGRASERVITMPRNATVVGRVITPGPCATVELSISNACSWWYFPDLPPGSTWEGFAPTSKPIELDENGRFTLDGLTPGTFDLTLRRGAACAVRRITIGPAQELTLTDRYLDAGCGWIVGDVRFEDGCPAAGALVTARAIEHGPFERAVDGGYLETTVDHRGRFRLGGTIESVYEVTVRAPMSPVFRSMGGHRRSTEVIARGMVVQDGRSESRFDVSRVEPLVTISGRVSFANAWPRRTRVVHTSDPESRTRDVTWQHDGSFAIDVVGDGPHTLTTTGSRGRATLIGPFRTSVEPGGTEEILLEPPNTELAVEQPEGAAGIWKVSVYRPESPERIAEMWLGRSWGRDRPDHSFRAGRIVGLDPGTYVLVASTIEGRLQSIESVEVRPGQRTTARFPEDSVAHSILDPRLAAAVDQRKARVEIRSPGFAALLGPHDGPVGRAHVLVVEGDRVELRDVTFDDNGSSSIAPPGERALRVGVRVLVDGNPIRSGIALRHELGFLFRPIPGDHDADHGTFLVPAGRYAVEVDRRVQDDLLEITHEGPSSFEIDVEG